MVEDWPPWTILFGLPFAAYLLLEDNQRRGRFLVSWLATYLGVTPMTSRSPHKCGECFNPFLEAGNEECRNGAAERRAAVRELRASRARFQAALEAGDYPQAPRPNNAEATRQQGA